MTLYEGRPADTAGRLEKEIRVYDFLDRLAVPYLRLDHPPAMTMEVCEGINQSLGALICKNLFLCNRQQTAFYLLMMPGNKPFKTKELSAQIGSSRLSFASAEHMEALLDNTPGSVSVLGLLHDTDNRVQLLMDQDILSDPFIGCHPCINTSSLRIATRDLTERVLPALHHLPRFVRLLHNQEVQP